MDNGCIVMRKVTRKGKVNGFEVVDALAKLGIFFVMLCMHCTNKGISLNLDLMNTSNCVVIMIMLMSIDIYV